MNYFTKVQQIFDLMNECLQQVIFTTAVIANTKTTKIKEKETLLYIQDKDISAVFIYDKKYR